MAEDQELMSLRKRLLELCPGQENEINQMSKDDLRELISMSQEVNEGKKQAVDSAPKILSESDRKINKMIDELWQIAPDIDRDQLRSLRFQDIEQIYQNYKKIAEQNRKKQELKKSESKKRKIIENGEVNVYEMKKTLIDKLPQYRNDIRNLSDSEIRRMYKDLQERNKANERQVKESAGYSNYSNGYNANNYSYSNGGYSSHQVPKAQMRSSNRFEDNDSYFQTPETTKDAFKKPGRSKKYKEAAEVPYNYDEPTRYNGNMQNDNRSMKAYDSRSLYSQSEYNPNFNKYKSEAESSFAGSNIFNNFQSFKPVKNSVPQSYEDPLPVDYKVPVQEPIVQNKQTVKQGNSQQKCKITFYLTQSDFDQSSSQEEKDERNKNDGEKKLKQKDDSRRRKNNLARLIETLRETFGRKSWKVQ